MSEASFSTSRQQREAQVSPKGRERGCPFLAPSFGQTKEGEYNKFYGSLRSFSLFAQRKRTKRKGSPITLVPLSGTSLTFQKYTSAAETRFAQTVLALIPSIFSKFGKVIMGYFKKAF
jgi:hypothetical protein